MPDAGPADELPEDFADCAAEQFLRLDGKRRDAALAALVAAHPEHAAGLARLWAELAAAERLLDGTYPDTGSSPAHIGGHRVLRRLGEGAFGIVYLCAQEQPVVRQVAIKVLRPGSCDDKTLVRFAAERQLLATLNHPAITQVFDAGAMADGRPFFVMEYVEGVPICAHCKALGSSCADRLRLFVEVCRGVAHAHAHRIVHRDLKSANVLVVDTERGPLPKIIDFGIAKALATSRGGEGPRTEAGRVIGTPGHMSPEQAAGRSDVDERADVFSLGVMLYELLTGELPWAQGAPATDAEPPRPSVRITASYRPSPTPTTSERRRLVAELRGDLDWITLKALAHERDHRYAKVTDLLADIERHLRGEAVSVGPPSVTYRLRKVLRRHRAVFAWASACLLVLALGATVAWRLRVEATTSEEARLTAVAEAVAKLQQRAMSPAMEGASDDLRKEILSDALALHERELRGRPERLDLRQLRLGVLNNLAWTCYYLGQYRQAIVFAEEARLEADELEHLEPGDAHRRARAIALREIGRCRFMIGELEAARAASASAIAAFEQFHERDPMANAMLLSGALVEYAAICGRSDDRDGQLAAQEHAVSVLQDFATARPDDAEAQRNLVRVQCGMANIMMARQQLEVAEAALLKAESLVHSLPLVTDEERALVDLRLGKFYAANGEPGKAVEHAARAARSTEATLQRNPGKLQQRSNLVFLHGLLFAQHTLLGDETAATVDADALLAMRDEPSPEFTLAIAGVLIDMARPAIDGKTMAGFARAEVLLARASQHLAVADGDRERRALRIEALAMQGHVSYELGRSWPVARWDEVLREAQAAGDSSWVGFARLQSSQRRLLDLDLDGARADLAAAGRIGGGVAPVDLDRQELAIELAARDHAAAARAAQRLVSADPSVLGKITTAIGYTRASSLASGGDADDQRAAGAYRASATALCAELAAAEPSQVQPLARAQAGLCLAELAAEPGPARELRAIHLPVLDGLRDHVPASSWNEALWLAAHLAAIRSALAERHVAHALAALEALVPRLQSPPDLVELCAVGVACLEPAAGATAGAAAGDAARAERVALQALRRAVERGLRGRQQVLDRADLLPLLTKPAFRELVTRIPD